MTVGGPLNTAPHAIFDDAKYLNLGTFRRSGVVVSTPVWFARHGASFYAFSASRAGKVKRIRNSAKAQVAHCTFRGTLLGPWFPAHAYLVAAGEEADAGYAALRAKYGWSMGIADVFAGLSGRIAQRQMIRIELGCTSASEVG